MSNVKESVSDAPSTPSGNIAFALPLAEAKTGAIETETARLRAIARDGMRRMRAARKLAKALQAGAKRPPGMDLAALAASQLPGRGGLREREGGVPIIDLAPQVQYNASKNAIRLKPVQVGEEAGVVVGRGGTKRILKVKVGQEVRSVVRGSGSWEFEHGQEVGVVRGRDGVWYVGGVWNRFGERVG